MAYRTVIADLYGNELAEVPARNLQYSFTLDSPGSCSFSLPAHHPLCTQAILTPGQREIRIYRGDAKVWGGYLWTAQQTQKPDTVAFAGEGWHSRLRRIRIHDVLTYTNLDQFDIAWNLVQYALDRNQSLAGFGLGISRTAQPLSGIKRDRTYPDPQSVDLKPVGEAIEDLTKVEMGFDFDINADKQFTMYYPQKGTRVTTAAFALDKNIIGWSLGTDATKVSPYMTAIGALDPITGVPLQQPASDAAFLHAYGLLEDVVSFTDVVVLSTLAAHANEALRASKYPAMDPQLSILTTDPPFGAYGVGDSVYLDLRSGYTQFQDWMRIISMTVAVANSGREAVGLFFNAETGI